MTATAVGFRFTPCPVADTMMLSQRSSNVDALRAIAHCLHPLAPARPTKRQEGR